MSKKLFLAILFSTFSYLAAIAQPANDDCSNATLVSPNGSYSGTNINATQESFYPPVCVTSVFSATKGVWYKVIGTNKKITADLCGTNMDTQILIYTGSCGSFTCVTGNDDACFGASRASWCSQSGITYYIFICGFSPSITGNFTLTTTESVPVVNITSGTLCSGKSFTMNPSGSSTYTYSGGSRIVSPTSNSSYTVTGGDGCNTASAVCHVTVNPSPTITVNSGSICSGDAFTMTPAGGNSYTYSGGSAVVSPTVNTSYTVTGTGTNGCENKAISSVTVNNLPAISVNSGSICSGNSFTMNPTGAITYTYSNGSAITTPTSNTSYTVAGTDANGCTNIALSSITVSALPNVTAISNISLLCTQNTATLNAAGANSYTWSTGESGSEIAISPTITTNYTVSGTDQYGCENNVSITQNVSPCTSVSESSKLNNIAKFYPNPVQGSLYIELISEQLNPTQLIITNILGEEVYHATVSDHFTFINTSHYKQGVYYVTINDDNHSQTSKILIQN